MKQENCLSELSSLSKSQLWGLILAGGDGQRLQNFVKQIYGYNRPKQYCTFTGKKSLIKNTLERVLTILPPNRIMTIVNRNHYQFALEEIGNQPNETIIVQPCNRDTSAGILYPLLKIYRQDSNSIVAIFPSDHFVYPNNNFMKHVSEAYNFVRSYPDSILVLGATPDRIETGFGWIEQGNCVWNNGFNCVHQVTKFWEKPNLELAKELWTKRCLWNTFVFVGSCESLISSLRNCVPEVYYSLEPIINYFGTKYEVEMINNIFLNMPAINFSRAVLQNIVQHLYVMNIDDVYWNDWGEEKSIQYDVSKFSLRLKTPPRSKKKYYHVVS
ncbi:MAG: sugar phosphate nucleotidyltransferase [bacterium]